MLTNRMLFTKDPLTTTIPNDGVAKVTEPQSAQEWDVLRYELTTFVCDGCRGFRSRSRIRTC